MDSSLLASESVFLKIPSGSPESPNFHDSIEDLREELKSLSWDQLIELENDKPLSTTMDENKSLGVRLTKSEALNLLNIAATLIQRNIRRYFQQNKYQDFLTIYKAAVKIQTAWRGYRTRNLDMKVLQLKHDYIVSKLQSKIYSMDKDYNNKMKSITRDKQLMTEIISLLCNEIDNLRSTPTFSFSKYDEISSSIEKKDSDPTTPTNDNASFYVNNPHLIIRTDSGVSLSTNSSNVIESVKGNEINVLVEKEHGHNSSTETKQIYGISTENEFTNQLPKDHPPDIYTKMEHTIGEKVNAYNCAREYHIDNDLNEEAHTHTLKLHSEDISIDKELTYAASSQVNTSDLSVEEHTHAAYTEIKSSQNIPIMMECSDDKPTEKQNVDISTKEMPCLELSSEGDGIVIPTDDSTPSNELNARSIDNELTFKNTSHDSDQSHVISFVANETIEKTVLANPKSDELVNETDGCDDSNNFLPASIIHDDTTNNPLDLVEGIIPVNVNSVIPTEVLNEKTLDNENIVHDFIQADSVEFINDSLQVDDSLDQNNFDNQMNDGNYNLENDAGTCFLVNVVVNGQQILCDTLQQDSVSINPIEADSLQFIEDSLQVD